MRGAEFEKSRIQGVENGAIARCEFCGETECLETCDWPVMDFVAMRVRDLEVGDLVRRFNDLRQRGPARVVEIQEFGNCSRRVVIEIPGKNRLGGNGPRVKVFTATAFTAIRIKRDTKCGRVSCAGHRCDRGPGGVYCADHWRLGEVAA